MSNDMNKTVREFYKAVEGVKNKKPLGYDTQATVRRIEDGVAWVHIPDGVDETPAKLTISAKEGDVVQVRIVNGRAFLVGNASAPPTDNTEAVKAMGQAGLAAEAASIARQKADEAVEDAATAHEAAMLAKDSADAAQASADAAQTSADNAQASATTANQAANSALAGLGTVESVLDVVTWFSEHKTATTDTTVQAGKSYYEYDASTGVLTKVDPEGTENPSEEGWYELDEAITYYVSTHLAQTNDGLNVVSSINGWRVLISSGGGNYNAGVYLIDPSGNIAQSTTAAGVAFNTGKPVNIGDSTAYINFDGNGHITVVGADFTIGGANNVSGTLTVKDASGNPVGTWTKDGISATAGTIGPLTITTNALYSGTLSVGTMTGSDGETRTLLEVNNTDKALRGFVMYNRVGIRRYFDSNSSLVTVSRYLADFHVEESTSQSPTVYTGNILLASAQQTSSGTYPVKYSQCALKWDGESLTFSRTARIPSSDWGADVYFIAPNIKITGSLYNQYGNTYVRPNVDNWLRINDLGAYSSGVYFGTSNVRTDGSWIQCGVGGTSSCSWLASTNIHARNPSGEAQIIAENANGTNCIYIYANNDGRVGLYSRRADGTQGAIISRPNNSNVITLGNGQGNVLTYSYHYNTAPPVVSNTTDKNRVSHFAGHSSYMAVVLQLDATDYSNRTITLSGSDIRLKENIAEPDLDALPVINSIQMHSFDWKDAHEYKHQPLGMVADELEKIDPRFAVGGGYDDDGFMCVKSVDTFYLVGYLVKAVQELSAEIDRMKKGMKAS